MQVRTMRAIDRFEDDDAFDELDEFADLIEVHRDGSDQLVSLKQFPGYDPNPPLVSRIPEPFRNIAYGEITTTSASKSREGLANLNQDMIYPQLRGIPATVGGHPALVQYDGRGNVIVRVLSTDQQRVVWQGRLPPIQMPRTRQKGRRDQQIEDRVRQRVADATGQQFRRHRVSGGGADLVRTGRRLRQPRRTRPAVAASRRRRATRRFDEFFAGDSGLY
jgi:hypothetical protein